MIYLGELMIFVPIHVQEDTIINDATFRFHYTFHSIPTIGFSVHLDGKSIYFSGDTFYNPPVLKTYLE